MVTPVLPMVLPASWTPPQPPTFEANRQKRLPVQLKFQTGGDILKERETLDAISVPITVALQAVAKSRLGGRVTLLEQLCPTNIKIAK